MKRFALLAALLAVLILPLPVQASHSAAGGAECGVREWDGVDFMTKGRTAGMVFTVDHTVGCKTVKIRNLVGTGRGESYGYPGQEANCVRYGQQDASNMFKWYFDIDVEPSGINVKCSPYSGPD